MLPHSADQSSQDVIVYCFSNNLPARMALVVNGTLTGRNSDAAPSSCCCAAAAGSGSKNWGGPVDSRWSGGGTVTTYCTSCLSVLFCQAFWAFCCCRHTLCRRRAAERAGKRNGQVRAPSSRGTRRQGHDQVKGVHVTPRDATDAKHTPDASHTSSRPPRGRQTAPGRSSAARPCVCCICRRWSRPKLVTQALWECTLGKADQDRSECH